MLCMHTHTHMLVSNSPCGSTVISFDLILSPGQVVCLCLSLSTYVQYVCTVCISVLKVHCMYV